MCARIASARSSAVPYPCVHFVCIIQNLYHILHTAARDNERHTRTHFHIARTTVEHGNSRLIIAAHNISSCRVEVETVVEKSVWPRARTSFVY